MNIQSQVRQQALTDVPVRKFILENRNGTRVDLLGSFGDSPWIWQPSGLGFGKAIETVQTINLDVIKGIKDERPDITGTFFFRSYAEYRVLTSFIETGQIDSDILNNTQNCLKLFYQTVNEIDNEYFYVYFTNVSKAEKEETIERLFCEFTCKRVSNLREDVVQTASNVTGVAPFPTFPLPTPNSDFILFSNTLTDTVTFNIQNLSAQEIPVKIVLEGSFLDPTWENVTNNLRGGYFLASGGLNGTLVVDANIPEVLELNGADASNNQDMTKDNFLYLSPGTNQINFTTTTSIIEGICTISLYYSRERLS